ncbi:MAG: hypothetical protein JXQ66_01160 [Campylobacterales bacterium]|nr:hypothetical protein [Campylobacterales bacterium]
MLDDKIIFIADNGREFLFDGSRFSEVPSKGFKNYLNASTIPFSNIRTHGFKTPKSTPHEKIEIQAELNMYEDGGLDPDTEFAISSFPIPLENSDDFYVESYGVEVSVLDEMFASTIKHYGHLDLIFPPSLSYSALYANSMLECKNDLFIHIGYTNSYAVIFKNGVYVSTRTISTIGELAQKVGVDAALMRDTLVNKGVKDELYSDEEFLLMSDTQEQLSGIAERIAHTIGHKRGIFGLDSIDRIFLDFEGSNIPGFLDLFNSYGYSEAAKEVLDIFIDTKVGMKHYAINALYAFCVYHEKIEAVNLTRYERKPTFLKTKVGHFSIVMVCSLFLASIYPMYAIYELQLLDAKERELKQSEADLSKITKKLQNELKSKRLEAEQLKDMKSKKELMINSYKDMVNVLEDFDKEAKVREKMLRDINQIMKKYRLSSNKIEFRDANLVNILIIAKDNDRDSIAEFIKELIYLGYSSVQTKNIQKYDSYYESLVEVKI